VRRKPLPDLAEREMRPHVGAEPRARRDQGRDAGHGDMCDVREDPAQLRQIVDEYSAVVRWSTASSIFPRRCRAAPKVGDGHLHRQIQTYATALDDRVTALAPDGDSRLRMWPHGRTRV
jgi:hypothetical protein